MGLAALETRLSFLDSVDDDTVPFFLSFVVLFFFFFFSLITSPRTPYIFPIALIWRVCLSHFGFVIMVLHFVTTFTIAMT